MKTIFIFGSIFYALVVACTAKWLCQTSVPPTPESSESLARLAVKNGGGQWVGIQEAEGMPYDLVLFNASTGSTLALKTTEITAERVREKLVAHENNLFMSSAVQYVDDVVNGPKDDEPLTLKDRLRNIVTGN